DPEPAEAVPRFPGHDVLRRRPAGPVPMGPRLEAEQGPHRRHVQPGPGPAQDPLEQVLHLPAGAKQQVAAVFGLAGRIAVTKPAAALLAGVQAEAQAGTVNPPVADLAQAL